MLFAASRNIAGGLDMPHVSVLHCFGDIVTYLAK